MLVDDHPVVRRGVRDLLEEVSNFRVVGEAGDGFTAVQMFETLYPAVVLLDLVMKGVGGIEVAHQLSKNAHPPAIIIYSVLSSEHHVLEALRAGAKGYVLKESPSEELVEAIRTVAAGGRFLCSQLSGQPALQLTTPDELRQAACRLTPREQEVLELSARGNTCAEIAQQLTISRKTVEAHRANMMRKLGLSSPAALFRYAFQNGIVDNGSYQVGGMMR
jgi:DNA-binding NarL/FixJ family response regulator